MDDDTREAFQGLAGTLRDLFDEGLTHPVLTDVLAVLARLERADNDAYIGVIHAVAGILLDLMYDGCANIVAEEPDAPPVDVLLASVAVELVHHARKVMWNGEVRAQAEAN